MIFFSNRSKGIIQSLTVLENLYNCSVGNSLSSSNERIIFKKRLMTIIAYKSSASVIDIGVICVENRMSDFFNLVIFDICI